MAILPRTFIMAFLLGFMFSSPETLAAASSGKRQVYVTASFVDKESLYVENLQMDEVQILENGNARKIELMVREEMPAVYGLLFDRTLLAEDRSGNRQNLHGITSSATAARDMAYELIDKHLRRQRMWVASFDEEFHLALAPTTDGFRAKEAINQMSFSRTFAGAFTYAGLYSAVMEMDKSFERRRVIILFLDSIDQESAGKITQLQNLLSMSNVELIIISFAARLSSSTGVPPALSRAGLSRLAQATAGEAYFSPDFGGNFEDLVRQIYNRIRTYYTFGFESDAPPDTKSELSIRCTRNGTKVKHHPFTPVLSAR
jgi:hypothetical protein